jgi:ankyrin repeat protein
MTKGTPVRRNTQDFELPATLIGATPYFLAAMFLEADIMRALAAGGADTQATMPSGDTALMAAAGLGASTQADRRGLSVLDGGRVEDEGRVVAAIAAAIAGGVDVNATNRSGNTALHASALLGYDQVIQQLVDAGARVDVKNSQGQTALSQLTARTGTSLRAPERSNRGARESTVALLRKLGASD